MLPPPSGFVNAFNTLSGLLACPACHGNLRLDADHVICTRCARKYPVIDGIPVLISGPEAETSNT